MKHNLILAVVVCLMVSNVAVAEPILSKTHVDDFGLEYVVTFDSDKEELRVSLHNPTDKRLNMSFAIIVDDGYRLSEGFNIKPKENSSYSFPLSEGIDVTRRNHTIEFLAGSNPLWFNFTKEINPSTTEGHPAPEITDISLETETYRGKEITVINVSAHNPSPRHYTTKITAHTFDTSFHGSTIQLAPYESSSGKIRLNESAGEQITGEVRMYYRFLNESSQGFDQVEINGRSDYEVEWWSDEYVPVDRFADDPYEYENESMHRAKVEAPETYAESPVVWTIGGVIGLALLLKIRRWLR